MAHGVVGGEGVLKVQCMEKNAVSISRAHRFTRFGDPKAENFSVFCIRSEGFIEAVLTDSFKFSALYPKPAAGLVQQWKTRITAKKVKQHKP
ncbi:MAG: hypothetical protein ABI642_14320 [Polaromonas sp.]